MIFTELSVPFCNLQFSDAKSETSTQEDQNNYQQQEYEIFHSLNHLNQQKTVKSKIKSSLCRNFTQFGFCPYGQKCQFAHGTNQLKINFEVSNKSYKTKRCNTFLKKGFCQYGYRCNFVHKQQAKTQDERQIKWNQIYKNFGDMFRKDKNVTQSRLMQILKL